MAYIITTFNKYSRWDLEHQRYKFTINDIPYAIFEIEYSWGIPQLPVRFDATDDHPEYYHIYDNFEEAKSFAIFVKSIN